MIEFSPSRPRAIQAAAVRGASTARVVFSRLVATLSVTVALVATGLVLLPQAAQADTAPAAGLPETASTDVLPTVQIDGVVWDQAIVGNTVYVAGEFTTARPAGAAPGVNTVPRANMLAYNLTTGVLINGFAPTFNAQVKSIAASPDGTKLYVGGNFTTVNGTNRYRVAALDAFTGALITSFAPTVNGPVSTVGLSNGSLFIGGNFPSVKVGSVTSARTKLASLNASNGALLPWVPTPGDGSVQALTVSPDGSKVAVGGSFTTFNGSGNPGYGLALVDSASGANLPLAANAQIRNGGTQSAILSLKGDADGFYGSGYHFGAGGNVEGSFQIDWSGQLKWVEDCHGDTYDIAPAGDVVYSASHKHYCGNIGTGGFPQTSPTWTFNRGTATTKFA
ncbi:MAG: delta-60 repeat domain-containing protein, partial [Flavobacterium sp.]|nr:delta-60 repeat domain-containing protein [Aeromicrobium sp.]